MVENSTTLKKIINCIYYRAINFLKPYKRIAWYTEKSCDILIFDDEGSDILLNCIPAKSSFFIIKNRVEIPLFVSLSFFVNLFFNVIEYRKPRIAIIRALIKHLKPKVIITYIDNSLAICKIKKLFPLIPLIAVQNGTRFDFSVKNRDRMEYDYYFSFGSVEADIFKQGGHTVSNFFPIGSLRAGIYLNEFFAEHKEKEFDLCYISQFDPIPHNSSEVDKWTYEMIASYHEVGKRYFYLIAKFAEENKLSLCVAMRYPKNSANFANENEYYSFLGQAKVEYIPQNGFSSYQAVQASRVCFTISSTLGYEALGWGERVIFAKDSKEVNSLVMQGAWTDNLVTHRLPQLQRLYSLDYSELSFKATELLKMTNEKYMTYSKNARKYYMNFDNKKKPHEIIKSKIAQFIPRGDRCDA